MGKGVMARTKLQEAALGLGLWGGADAHAHAVLSWGPVGGERDLEGIVGVAGTTRERDGEVGAGVERGPLEVAQFVGYERIDLCEFMDHLNVRGISVIGRRRGPWDL